MKFFLKFVALILAFVIAFYVYDCIKIWLFFGSDQDWVISEAKTMFLIKGECEE